MLDDLVTVIIVTRNRATVLARTLKRIRDAGLRSLVIVYDDASDDAGEECANAPNCQFIHGSMRGGPAVGRNRGAAKADTPFLLLLDDDTYPLDRAPIERAIEILTADPNAAAVTFRNLRTDDGSSSCPASASVGLCGYLLGGSSMVRTVHFHAVGGFRECLQFGAEDTDLAWRLIAAGFSIYEDPGSVIVHEHTPVARDAREECWFYARNILLLNALNLPWPYGLVRGLAAAFRRVVRGKHVLGSTAGYLAGCWYLARRDCRSSRMQMHTWRYIQSVRRHV